MAFKGELSDYELMIKRNQEMKMAILEQIGITDVKSGVMKTIKELTSAKKRKLEKKQWEPQELRRSLRLMSNGLGPVMVDKFRLSTTEQVMEEESAGVDPIYDLKSFDFDDVCVAKETQYDEFFNGMDLNAKTPQLKSDEYLSKMKIVHVGKVVPERITAMAIHPSPHKILVAAGSKKGNLGVWSIESQSKRVVLKPHYGLITSLAFNPVNHDQLISASYDGSLRCADLTKYKFNKLYSTEELCTSFDFITPTAYIISRRDGSVVIMDSRSNSMKHAKHKCNEEPLKCVSVHPEKNHFLTASNRGSVCLWDLRYLKKQPITDLQHERCVTSAYFSPTSGNHIVTVSMDDKLSIYESTQLSSVKLKTTRKHNNQTGRWLTNFQATWLQGFKEELFVIGNMNRYIEVYRTNGKCTHVFANEAMSSITSLNVFHPTQFVLAGGNSSGKVFVFKDSM